MKSSEGTPSAARRSYQAPQLHAYGAMRDLTKGGTEGSPEAGSTASMKRI
jgi:hypothetical protein